MHISLSGGVKFSMLPRHVNSMKRILFNFTSSLLKGDNCTSVCFFVFWGFFFFLGGGGAGVKGL